MTAIAALVAEALAAGEARTLPSGRDLSSEDESPRYLLTDDDGSHIVEMSTGLDEVSRMTEDWPDLTVYYRGNVVDAALAHLAERCAKAEARGDALEGRSGLMEAVSAKRLELLEKAEERAGKAEAATKRLLAALGEVEEVSAGAEMGTREHTCGVIARLARNTEEDAAKEAGRG